MLRTSHIAVALAVLYAIVFGFAGPSHGWEPRHILASALLAPLLVALTVIDLSTYRLPDRLTLLVFILGLTVVAPDGSERVIWNLIAAGLGVFGLFAVAQIYRRFRGRAGLGLGDAKLYGAAGMWVGLDGLSSVLLVACLSALIAVAAARINGRQITATTPFPFGPFLCFGLWTAWNFGPWF